jgi:hypothetical protein
VISSCCACRRWRFNWIVLTLVVVLAVGVATLPMQATVTTNTSIPITLGVDIPCAGEVVVLNGPLHILFSVTFDSAGGFHMMALFQPQGISGLGQTSGAKYQATGETEFQTNAKAVPFETSFVNNFKIIGQGPGNNLLIHENMHLTVNADCHPVPCRPVPPTRRL